MDNNKLIKGIILSQKDFDKLPRNGKGECIYDGNLYINNNQLKGLPANLVVKGSLDCYGNQLKELPNDLVVKGNLICNNNQLTSLPEVLKVGGHFYCSNNQITSLPNGLKINGNLYCFNNRITKVIKCEIGGEIVMDKVQQKNYDRVIKINKLKEIIHE